LRNDLYHFMLVYSTPCIAIFCAVRRKDVVLRSTSRWSSPVTRVFPFPTLHPALRYLTDSETFHEKSPTNTSNFSYFHILTLLLTRRSRHIYSGDHNNYSATSHCGSGPCHWPLRIYDICPECSFLICLQSGPSRPVTAKRLCLAEYLTSHWSLRVSVADHGHQTARWHSTSSSSGRCPHRDPYVSYPSQTSSKFRLTESFQTSSSHGVRMSLALQKEIAWCW